MTLKRYQPSRRLMAAVATTLLLLPCVDAFQAVVHVVPRQQHSLVASSLQRRTTHFPSLLLARSNNKNEDEAAPNLPFGIFSLDKRELPAERDSENSGGFLAGTGVANLDVAGRITALTDTAQDAIDGATGGWALGYADLSPDSTSTLPGQAFLLTNAAYFVAGILVVLTGDFWFGFWTDVAAVASFNYHYNQLMEAGETKADNVRLALLFDYTAAAIAMLTATAYLISGSLAGPPMVAFGVSAASLGFLGLSWVWEYGRPYMFWHSLWHLCSAYAGYLIGTSHATAVAAGL